MVLKVSVGESAFCPQISPYGTRPEFNQSLESITDTKCKTVSLVDKLHNCFFNLCVLECSCKEFRRAIWFITSGESTWEHNDLSLVDCFCEEFHGIMDIFCCQVLEYFNVNLCTSAFKSTCAVVFAVCSREYRDKYTRFCNFVFAYINVFCMVQVIFCLFFVVFTRSCLEYSFQSSLPCFFSFFFSNNSISVREFTVICNFTDQCM